MRVLIVDVANVMGSRPDGWWRDRLKAANRLLAQFDSLPVDDETWRFDRIVAVVEGRASRAAGPVHVDVVRAPGSGDDTIVQVANQLAAVGDLVVVTADRELRTRLPPSSSVLGPQALLEALTRSPAQPGHGE